MTFILHWIANNLIPDATIRQAFSDLFIPMYIGIVINFQKVLQKLLISGAILRNFRKG